MKWNVNYVIRLLDFIVPNGKSVALLYVSKATVDARYILTLIMYMKSHLLIHNKWRYVLMSSSRH